MPNSSSKVRRRTATKRKTIADDAFILFEHYLRLYESEGWPPEGFSSLTPANAAARRRLHRLTQLGIQIEIWLATGDTNSEAIHAQFHTDDTNDVTDAIRLAVCQGRLAASTTYRAPNRQKSVG